MTTTDAVPDVPDPVPASFLPPPRGRRRSFKDEPLLQAPDGGLTRAERLARLAAEALAENPDCGTGVPWETTARERARRRRGRG
ncbi:MAG: hypothetical protein ACRDYV_00100 [Acidimicrobiia bacterium]